MQHHHIHLLEEDGMKIAVDAMGGDMAPYEIFKGAADAAQRGTPRVLVGSEKVIYPMLKQYSTNSHISIVDAPEVIGFEETPTKAVRRKRNSSIVMGMDLVNKGEAAAFVSAGHTGAVVTAAILNLGKAKGVLRPALGILLPYHDRAGIDPDIGPIRTANRSSCSGSPGWVTTMRTRR